MTIEERLSNLENLVNQYIKSQRMRDAYGEADIGGLRHTDGVQAEAIGQNSEDITDTMNGLTDTYEEVQTNTSDIDICMEAITELYEMIEGGV